MGSGRHLEQRIRVHLLRMISAVEKQRSLTRASAAIGVSQPSLTKSLHVLEEIVQAPLFERHARGVRITEAGAAVARTANRILAELRQLETELDRMAGRDPEKLALGALPTAASGILPGVISRLATSHPHLRVHLEQGHTEELLSRLADGEIELVVGRLYELPSTDDFRREALWEEPISVLARAGHALFDSKISRDSLRGYTVLLPSVTQRVAQETEQLIDALNLDPKYTLRSSSFGFIREMLHETDSISIMPSLMMVGDLLRGTLKIVPLSTRLPPRPAGLITVAGRPLGPAARLFVGCLRRYIAEIGAKGL